MCYLLLQSGVSVLSQGSIYILSNSYFAIPMQVPENIDLIIRHIIPGTTGYNTNLPIICVFPVRPCRTGVTPVIFCLLLIVRYKIDPDLGHQTSSLTFFACVFDEYRY